MKKQIRILKGLHAGAQASIGRGEQLVIGSDPACAVVLCDPGVAPRHCAVSMDGFGVTCRALEASIVVDGKQVPIGSAVSVADLKLVRCGTAILGIGPADAATEWSALGAVLAADAQARRSPVRTLKRVNPYVLFLALSVGLTALFGAAYAALSDRSSTLTPARIETARAWLKTVAPAGSELQIVVENQQRLLITGYVSSSHQRGLLVAAAADSPHKPRVDVYVVDELLASLSRLAQLESLPCVTSYQGGGRVECKNVVPSDDVATRLRVVARQVPGLAALDVRVAPPAPIVAYGSDLTAPRTVAPTKISKKFSVIVFKKGRYLVGEHGEKYTEGDVFDGFTIAQIGVDEVIFKRDGREYAFYVAALGGGAWH